MSSIISAWAPWSWSRAPLPAGSRPPPRIPCTRWRSAGRPRRRGPAGAPARPRRLAGRPYAGHHLGPVERLPQAGPLHHPQGHLLYPLEGGEATFAAQAFASPADGGPVLGQARIHDAIIVNRTPRASHTADDSQGISRCSPGTIVEEPVSAANRCTRLGVWSGATWRAIDVRESPFWTT